MNDTAEYAFGCKPSLFVRLRQRCLDFKRRKLESLLYWLLEYTTPECNLVGHAQQELSKQLKLPADDIDRWMADHLVRMARMFSLEGHSGFSGSYALAALGKLLDFQPLGPLTGEDDEWTLLDYGEEMKYQNKRCGHVFKGSDGRAYDSEGRIFRDPNGGCFTSRDSRVYIEFPYTPAREYVDVPASR